ncbi:MAG: hypothetical protein WBK20_06390 [Spirochaetota bacterium]
MKKILTCLLIISLFFLHCDPMSLKIYIRNFSNYEVKIIVTHRPIVSFEEKNTLSYIDNVSQEITYDAHKDYKKTLKIKKIDESNYEFIIKPKTTVFLEPYLLSMVISKVEIIYNGDRKSIIFYGENFNRREMEKSGLLEFKYPLAIINIK